MFSQDSFEVALLINEFDALRYLSEPTFSVISKLISSFIKPILVHVLDQMLVIFSQHDVGLTICFNDFLSIFATSRVEKFYKFFMIFYLFNSASHKSITL